MELDELLTKIRAVLKELPQTEIATEAGLTQATVSRFMRGEESSVATVKKLHKVAKEYQTKIGGVEL